MLKPPSCRDLGIRQIKRRLKLHCKDVQTLSLADLLDLPSRDESIREVLRDNARWLHDPEKYDAVPPPPPSASRPCKLPDEFMDDIAAKGKAEPLPEGERPRSLVDVFTVKELFKLRERLIEHPWNINAATKENVPVTKFLSQLERHNALLFADESSAADLDASAWFDQFEVDETVRNFFCFEHNGRWWRLRVLPMGLRQSVAIAHAATRQLLNFDHDGVLAEPYIDNVRFVGPPDLVRKAVLTFIERCKRVGVTLNEVDVSKDTETVAAEAESLVRRQQEWLGECYDFESKTVAITEKTRTKITEAATVARPTWRNFASRISLLRYASSTTGISLAPYYASLRAFSSAASVLSCRPDLWDAPAWDPQPHVAACLERWTQDVLSAPPRVIKRTQKPVAVLITDASDWGFGGIFITADGALHTHAQEWTPIEKLNGMTKRSVHAEPNAIVRLLRRFVRPKDHTAVLVLSDNDAAVRAFTKGHSPAFVINKGCLEIQSEFPNLSLSLCHVPGAANPSDGLSRGHDLSVEDWVQAMHLARAVLDTGVEDGVHLDPVGRPTLRPPPG